MWMNSAPLTASALPWVRPLTIDAVEAWIACLEVAHPGQWGRSYGELKARGWRVGAQDQMGMSLHRFGVLRTDRLRRNRWAPGRSPTMA